MTQLHNVQDAIKQAIDGGYDEATAKEAFDTGTEYAIFLDPLFWQALGKARGWPYMTTANIKGLKVEELDWHFFAEEWFETRMSNGDETKFWESLP